MNRHTDIGSRRGKVDSWVVVDSSHCASLCSTPGGVQSSSRSTSAKSLSLNLKKHYDQSLEQLPASTPAWPLRASACAESYLNLLNLENRTKPAALTDLDPFIRTNGTADAKQSSDGDIVQLPPRNSTSLDER